MPSETIVQETESRSMTLALTDAEFTNACAQAAGPRADRRLSAVIASLTRHLHAFCTENEITADEFAAAVDFVRFSILVFFRPND